MEKFLEFLRKKDIGGDFTWGERICLVLFFTGVGLALGLSAYKELGMGGLIFSTSLAFFLSLFANGAD